jgi:cyanophycin synthetase
MEFLEARRLTGPNVLWDEESAILDISCSADENESITHARIAGGVSIAFSAPIDALYAATSIAEWAWACCDAEFRDATAPDFAATVTEITQAITGEVNPPLLLLEQAAVANNVSFLWDDDDVSVGLGSGSTCWPFRELPAPDEVDWSAVHEIPVGVVTGTNGKTTTVRIAKHILQSAGKNVGLSCTDWISVNDRIIDRDDWSGPGGARMVLRQKDVDVAILETARGGLLRRGLGINKADAAVITNIAEDHLGDFGSQSLAELLNIKWVVSHAVAATGRLILNADDALLVKKSEEFDGIIIWFSLNDSNPVVSAHVERGGVAFVYTDEDLVRLEGSQSDVICAAREIPITLDAAAAHNIANSLGAAALTEQLGLSMSEIGAGLTTMSQDANPGRSNLYSVNGFEVLVDFAHNPEAMQALFAMARAIPAKRTALCFGQAGDRTDEQIKELARSAWAIGLDRANIAELADYARGRAPGEVFGIIRDELLKCGAREEQIRHFQTESESFDAALDWAEQGDLVVILDLGRDSNVQQKLNKLL